MLVKDEVLTFIDAKRIQGISAKTGKNFDLITVTVMDDDFNALKLTLADQCKTLTGDCPDWMKDTSNKGNKIVCTINVTPSGFGLTGVLKEWEPER